MVVFHKNTRKQIQILLKFHLETIEPSIGFIVAIKFQKNWNNKNKE